jgi:hypothetical protein
VTLLNEGSNFFLKGALILRSHLGYGHKEVSDGLTCVNPLAPEFSFKF